MTKRIKPYQQSGKRIHPFEIRNGNVVSQETRVFDAQRLPGEFVIDTAASVGLAAKRGNSLTTGVTPDRLSPFINEMAQFALMNYDRVSVSTIFRDTDAGTLNDMVKAIGSVSRNSLVPHKELIIVGSVDPLVNIANNEPSPGEVLDISELTKTLSESATEYRPSIAVVTGQLAMEGISLANHTELLRSFDARTRSFTGADSSLPIALTI